MLAEPAGPSSMHASPFTPDSLQQHAVKQLRHAASTGLMRTCRTNSSPLTVGFLAKSCMLCDGGTREERPALPRCKGSLGLVHVKLIK